MYVTTTATRDFALKAAAAAERAMKRHECCKSQFKFKCFSCGEMINRGDKITKCTAAQNDGMRLRFRGGDSRNDLEDDETAYYLAESGSRTWVHIGCNPCFWDSLPEDSDEYSPPALCSAYTDWGCKISYEFEEWRQLTNHYDMEEFLEKHGYPQEKWMKDRVIRNVTRFQALWRGYIYKQAYPTALAQHKTIQRSRRTQVLRYLFDITIKSNDCMLNWLHEMKVGDHGEILMDHKKKKEAIYSCEIIKKELNGGDDAYIYVKFHHDGEVRIYHWKRYVKLIHECKNFKLEKEIEAKIIGKLPTGRLRYSIS